MLIGQFIYDKGIKRCKKTRSFSFENSSGTNQPILLIVHKQGNERKA
jgi:hypothetical protein